MLTLNDGRSELWQWDTGRKLTVDAECSRVHFSNKVFGRSVDVDVENKEATIPDVLLQSEKDIYAWAFVGTPENGYTKISRIFKVNRRNKPADYVFTPEEQTTIQEIKDIAQSVRNDADSGKFNGKNGVSATHEWDGTILVVTSASGTSSANLKGEKGDKGSRGDRGEPGRPGITPIKGDDYWTDADKQEIVDEVLGEVPQPDWEQSDSDAPDYVKNRPFHMTVLIEEQTVDIGSDGIGRLSGRFKPIEGKTYVVHFNGIPYTCKAYGMYQEDGTFEGAIALGNIDISAEANMTSCVNKGNGEPFAIEANSSGIAEVYVSGKDDCTFKIVDIFADEEYKKAINVQSDWNQNDPTAPDYIKNRPFRVGEIVVLEEQTVTTEDTGDGIISDCFPGVVLEPGKTYSVTLNGTVYECVAEAMDEENVDPGHAAMGNGDLLDWYLPGHGISSEDVPFAIAYVPEAGYILFTEEEGAYTVKVTSGGGVVIDPVYQKAIKAVLPTVEMVATLEDGTKQTLKLYGEAVKG